MVKFLITLFVVMMPLETKPSQTNQTAYDFEFESIDGGTMRLSQFSNKVLLVVNTASYCGFTRQYSALQSLWDKYKERGLVVIGVPSGDFGNQEHDSNKKIKEFCEINFNINFPMTSKTYVKGQKAHAFYKWVGTQVGFAGKPRWNFHKFLISNKGQVVDWYASTTRPNSSKLKAKIEEQLSNIK